MNETAITRIDVFAAREMAPDELLARVRAPVERTGWPFWVHFDVDVLDQAVMPAVDFPGSPGVEPDVLAKVLHGLVASERCCALTETIFDSDLDPMSELAALLVTLLGRIIGREPDMAGGWTNHSLHAVPKVVR